MSKARALIIDDELDILELLGITLERMQIEVSSAPNLKTAMTLLQREEFQLCLTDMKLADGDGLTVVEWIQQFRPHLPVAVITAHGNIESAVRALKLGAFDFLTKPYDKETVRPIVQKALKTRLLAGHDASKQEGPRARFGIIGASAPIFLVNGNHEQAARYILDGTPNNVAVWAQNARNRFYPQPAPDGFYSGNAEVVPHIGLLRDYFAWEWGDALFVVIDPYWSSPAQVDTGLGGQNGTGGRTNDKWAITHGDPQYEWLKQTLQQSKAKWKFVFAHHVMGTGRGGVEIADQYEWGGNGANGRPAFACRVMKSIPLAAMASACFGFGLNTFSGPPFPFAPSFSGNPCFAGLSRPTCHLPKCAVA
mgnify:CR=1 FL=1